MTINIGLLQAQGAMLKASGVWDMLVLPTCRYCKHENEDLLRPFTDGTYVCDMCIETL